MVRGLHLFSKTINPSPDTIGSWSGLCGFVYSPSLVGWCISRINFPYTTFQGVRAKVFLLERHSCTILSLFIVVRLELRRRKIYKSLGIIIIWPKMQPNECNCCSALRVDQSCNPKTGNCDNYCGQFSNVTKCCSFMYVTSDDVIAPPCRGCRGLYDTIMVDDARDASSSPIQLICNERRKISCTYTYSHYNGLPMSCQLTPTFVPIAPPLHLLRLHFWSWEYFHVEALPSGGRAVRCGGCGGADEFKKSNYLIVGNHDKPFDNLATTMSAKRCGGSLRFVGCEQERSSCRTFYLVHTPPIVTFLFSHRFIACRRVLWLPPGICISDRGVRHRWITLEWGGRYPVLALPTTMTHVVGDTLSEAACDKNLRWENWHGNQQKPQHSTIFCHIEAFVCESLGAIICTRPPCQGAVRKSVNGLRELFYGRA